MKLLPAVALVLFLLMGCETAQQVSLDFNGLLVLFLVIFAAVLVFFIKKRGIAAGIEKIVEQKTKELRKKAEEAQTSFLANMIHEIRTPMNSIIGFTELALDDQISGETKNYLNKILVNAHGLLHVVNDILDITKIETGKMELERVPFEIQDVFTLCQSTIMPKAMEQGAVIHFSAEPCVGKKLMGDSTRLRQILINIIFSAVKFTNFGEVKVLACVANSGDDTTEIHFEIIDNGVGMTPEQIATIYEPFIQAETGTMRKYEGTGLGLSIARSMIELMGGELSIESKVGEGSKFSFDLVFDTIVAQVESHFEKKQSEIIAKPMFKGEILLCEDNQMNQDVVKEHLSRVGLKTTIAVNGKEGVDIVSKRHESGEKRFDLIFMDIQMPVMDGLEAASRILALGTGTPIVAMTANIMTKEKEYYKEYGMRDCVGKPFTSQELWRCLLKYLSPIETGKNNENEQSS